jgi:hypothetical protein
MADNTYHKTVTMGDSATFVEDEGSRSNRSVVVDIAASIVVVDVACPWFFLLQPAFGCGGCVAIEEAPCCCLWKIVSPVHRR